MPQGLRRRCLDPRPRCARADGPCLGTEDALWGRGAVVKSPGAARPLRGAAWDDGAFAGRGRRGWPLFGGKAGCIVCHPYDAGRPFFTDFESYNTGVGWWAAKPDLGR